MSQTRDCTRCSTGTETCFMGNFYTCSVCDIKQSAEDPDRLAYALLGSQPEDSLEKILDDHKLWLSGKGGARANLRYAKSTNLRGADLRSANLRGADLRSANLRDADLRSAYLYGANLQHANLRYANLRSADLRSANLQHADLGGANLRGANLRGADLRDANLQGANLRDADLGGANLIGVTGPYKI